MFKRKKSAKLFPDRTKRAYSIYSRKIISIYDLMVYGIANPYIWFCPNTILQANFERYMTSNHLDVGVGTGYLLNKAADAANEADFTLSLLDMNQDCLNKTELRLQRYNPSTIVHNILEPLDSSASVYESISVNYLIHCIPGSLNEKCQIISNLKAALDKNGVIFGATILGIKSAPKFHTRCVLRFYNFIGLFNNIDDDKNALERELKKIFSNVEIRVVGSVALFSARD